MGVPVEGTAGVTKKGSGIAPVIIAGVTAGGVIVPIKVDASGIIQVGP